MLITTQTQKVNVLHIYHIWLGTFLSSLVSFSFFSFVVWRIKLKTFHMPDKSQLKLDVCVCVCTLTWVPGKVRRDHQIAWSWSPRRL